MARRNRGIFERKNREGFWYRDYRNGGDVWKRMGETRREANRALDRLLALSAPPARITVAQAVERWLASAVATRRNPRFARGTATAAELHLLPALGMRPLAMVTKDDVRAYRLTLEAKKLSPQSVKNLLSDLRAVLWWAVDVDLLDRTPFPRRVMPRVQETAPDPFTADEWKALVKVGGAHGFAVRFLVGTGLRFGEGSRAQAAHVARGMLVVSQTKSGRVRRIPLAPALLEEVRGRVGRLVPFTASGSFNRTVRRLSGVTLFHAHRCRDTFACRLLEGGASLATVQELLGHQSVTTTQRYARLSEGAVVRETERSWG